MRALTAPDFARVARNLAANDPALGAVVAQFGLPAFWQRPPGFPTLCLFIVEQQVSLASAKAVFDRVVGQVGLLTPATLVAAGPETLGKCGVTRQKQRYLLGLADLIMAGELDLNGLASLPDPEVRSRLLALTGIGPWTADVYLLSALRRPDLWPAGDRALQVGTAEVLGLRSPPAGPAMEEVGLRWRPWRSVAARLIWHSYLARRGRSETEVSGLSG